MLRLPYSGKTCCSHQFIHLFYINSSIDLVCWSLSQCTSFRAKTGDTPWTSRLLHHSFSHCHLGAIINLYMNVFVEGKHSTHRKLIQTQGEHANSTVLTGIRAVDLLARAIQCLDHNKTHDSQYLGFFLVTSTVCL